MIKSHYGNFWIQPKNHVMENHTMENHVMEGITVLLLLFAPASFITAYDKSRLMRRQQAHIHTHFHSISETRNKRGAVAKCQ